MLQKLVLQIHSTVLVPITGTCVVEISDRILLVPDSGAD